MVKKSDELNSKLEDWEVCVGDWGLCMMESKLNAKEQQSHFTPHFNF